MTGSRNRRRCAVLGSPIAHSLSPVLHRAAYRHLRLDWIYERHEVTEEALAGFVAGLDESWRGLSLTMPLKEVALALADEVSAPAGAAEAANTLLFEPDGRRVADNTDVPGLAAALAERGAGKAALASVLGGGATARSTLVSLAGLVPAADVFVRTPSRAADLEAAGWRVGLTVRVRPWAEAAAGLVAPIVVATAPRGACDNMAGSVPANPGALLDVVYDPWPTRLAAAWRAAGGAVASGLDLLVHQAALQVLLMTGRAVPLAVLREAIAEQRGA